MSDEHEGHGDGGGDAAPESPRTAIVLWDGTTLEVADTGIRLGAQTYRFDQLEDARLLSFYPETIGLRTAAVGPMSLVPAQPGGAYIALEAIYRARPDLRPIMPAPPPGYVAPPGGVPPYGPAIVPYAAGPGAPPPRGRRAGLGYWPQDIGQIFVATFRVYFQNFGKIFLLSVAAALPAALIGGCFTTAELYLEGYDVTQSYFQNFATLFTFTPGSLDAGTPPPVMVPRFLAFSPEQVVLVIVGGVALGVLLLFLSAWQLAALALGAREAVLGRPVRVGAALRGGLRRLFPVLGAVLLVGLIVVGIYIVALVLGVACRAIAAELVAGSASSGGTPVLGLFLLLPLLILGILAVALVAIIFLSVRLGLVSIAAACDGIGPGGALAQSWSLVRGNWWRTFLPLLLVGLIAGTASGAAEGPGLFAPIVVDFLVLVPVAAVLVAPLSVLATVIVYYDLRLRREGYVALTARLGLLTTAG